ncbi:MAG TPA: ATP-binding cassette domain-containing protein, partial [Candidatus Binatia bacterium]
LENVMLPLFLDGRSRSEAGSRAEALLHRVGLGARKDHLPEELSGGENQRMAIARALVFAPPILLADEPTGNLDSKTGDSILELMRQINREEGCTVVMVTHNPGAAGYGHRVIHLGDGLIQENHDGS